MDSVGTDHHSGELVFHPHATAVRVRGVSSRESAEGEDMDEHMKTVRWMMLHGATAEEIQRYVGLAEGTTSETPTEAEVIAAPTVAPVVANSAPPTVAVNRPRRVERPEARRAVAVRKPPGRPEYVAPDILKILATGPATAREIASLLYPETNENIAVKRLQNALTKLVRSERVKVVEHRHVLVNGIACVAYVYAMPDAKVVPEDADARGPVSDKFVALLRSRPSATTKECALAMYGDESAAARSRVHDIARPFIQDGRVTLTIRDDGARVYAIKRDGEKSASHTAAKTNDSAAPVVDVIMRNAIKRAITTGNNSITSITRSVYGDESAQHVEAMTTTLDALEHEGVLRSHAGKGGNSYTLAYTLA